MREIKFRGYCDRDSEWRYGYYITDGKIHEINTLLRDDKTLYGSQIDIESLGQYTGLKDKNGVEIYEGDIMMAPYMKKKPCVVEYSKTLAKFTMSGKFNFTSIDSNLEVIGNIYENKELLA